MDTRRVIDGSQRSAMRMMRVRDASAVGFAALRRTKSASRWAVIVKGKNLHVHHAFVDDSS
jgi:predicted component of type VI protein secretion system